MKETEFRIGNLIGFYRSGISEMLIGTIAEIGLIENSSEYQFTVPEFNPNIPLTGKAIKGILLSEEWLLRLPDGLIFPEWIKYVHTLQNWYFYENKCEKELEFK